MKSWTTSLSITSGRSETSNRSKIRRYGELPAVICLQTEQVSQYSPGECSVWQLAVFASARTRSSFAPSSLPRSRYAWKSRPLINAASRHWTAGQPSSMLPSLFIDPVVVPSSLLNISFLCSGDPSRRRFCQYSICLRPSLHSEASLETNMGRHASGP